jgi:hypothetical protein
VAEALRPAGYSVATIPGGLLLVASLRGIRWTYDATARAEVYDTYTDQKVGEYEAKTTHRLVHRASVPGSFFGAAIFVPAIVQGAKHTRVRPVYKRMLSEESYTTLWRQIGGQLMKDHTAYQEIAARAQRQRPSYTSFAGRARVEPQRPAARRPAVLPPSPRPSELTSTGVDFGNYYALVIGNNDYQSLPKLRSAVNDARRISELLMERYGYGVTTLENASRSDIISGLGDLRRTLTEHDNLLIYYAGHGWLDQDADEGYWLPVDATADDEVNWVANSAVTGTIRAMKAKHVLLVADSCYSGKLTRGVHIKRGDPEYIRRLAEKRARVVLTSGGLEPVADSGGGQGHSVFAAAFLDILEKNEGILEGHELYALLKRPVALNSDQIPEYSDLRKAGHDGGDFLFVFRQR